VGQRIYYLIGSYRSRLNLDKIGKNMDEPKQTINQFDTRLMFEVALKRGQKYWDKLVIPPGPYKMRHIPGTTCIEIMEPTENMDWIRITERLPTIEEDVLFCAEIDGVFGDIHLGWYEGSKTAGDSIAMETVPGDPGWWFPCTHWMPLPEKPKSEPSGISGQLNL